MPPKGAAHARAKARGKAKAKAGVRRPAAAAPVGGRVRPRLGLRRPGVAPGREPTEEVRLQELGIVELLSVGALRVTGTYWDSPVELVGVPRGIHEEDSAHFVRLEARGTKQEKLLRFLSGSPRREVLLHLCDDPCTKLVWRDGVVHLQKAVKVGDDIEDWMNNALDVRPPIELDRDGVDELGILREEQARVAPGRGDEPRKEAEKRKHREDRGVAPPEEEPRKGSSSRRLRPEERRISRQCMGIRV